jgi:hypothetical protein
MSSLRFGARARGIQSTAQANVAVATPEARLAAAQVGLAEAGRALRCPETVRVSQLNVPEAWVCSPQAEIKVLKHRLAESGGARARPPVAAQLPLGVVAAVWGGVVVAQLAGIAVFFYSWESTCTGA